MANNCAACEDLKTLDPNLLVNGIDDSECTSLKNDTGLVASNGHNDCTDLEDMNDCLIKNMTTEINAYNTCSWKDYAKAVITNIWMMFKAIICSICGIWTNIHNLWSDMRNVQELASRIDCIVNYLAQGYTFSLNEAYADPNHSYIVAGKGVSFLNVGSSGTSSNISISYIAGGFCRLSGSCKFYNANFTDGDACYNFDDNGSGSHHSSSRSGNSNWVGTNEKPGGTGSELVYEIRIKKSDFPQIQSFFDGIGVNSENGGYHVNIRVFSEGSYAWGQHGDCDMATGAPVSSGNSNGHLVPAGWQYIQLRITWIESMSANANGRQYSQGAILGVRMNPSAISC